MPDPTEIPSLRARLAALPVGGTVAECERIVMPAESETIRTAAERLRNTMSAATARAKREIAGAFTIETLTGLTKSGDILVTCASTRTL